MNYIGIDISKDSFVVAFPSENNFQMETFENNPKGIQKFIKKINQETDHCILEATGNYSTLLLYLLDKQGFRVSLLNPKQTHFFAKMMLSVAKTDLSDAVRIALYGQKMNPPLYKMPSENLLLLKQKRAAIRQLKKQKIASQNLKHSLEVLPLIDKKTMKVVSQTISFLELKISELEKELVDLAQSQFDKQIKLLTSIKGIGITLATSLVIATGGFSLFENPKQISRFLGICPTYQQSGSSLNIKGSINKNGDTNLRTMLYVASWSAVRYNQACKETYNRLKINGKPSKVALIAVANKLIRQAFAVVKSEMPYQDGVVSKNPNQNLINI